MSAGLWERKYPYTCSCSQRVAKAKGRTWLPTDLVLIVSRIGAWWPCGQNHKEASVSSELGIPLKPGSRRVRTFLTKK